MGFLRRCWRRLVGRSRAWLDQAHAARVLASYRRRFREQSRRHHQERSKLLREIEALKEDIDTVTRERNRLESRLEIAKVEVEGIAAAHETLLQLQLAQTAIAVRRRTDAEQSPIAPNDED